MFEVFGDGTESEHTVIGRATQFLNNYNGVPLANNCIVITSDANGLHSVSNKWRTVDAKGEMKFTFKNGTEISA